ncbi:unnamed protein product [Oikopleura dioica]|uniref:C3H1-type domain-containing protein n=1 Tax=Oikopleura dioica TaxID=34765 RepID=E4YUL4_OIKDI|nr:unnamed protein product [Oikopleura dioica]
MDNSQWTKSEGLGRFPHKTPSGAFDPEVFANPVGQNLSKIDESGLKRTASLGLKTLATNSMLMAQVSVDSVFSHCEGETIDESAAADAIAKPSSNPIGTGLRPTTPTNQHTFEISSTSPGSLSPSPNKIKELDGPSVTSLPDRIACEATAAEMTNAVLSDSSSTHSSNWQQQIDANDLFQNLNLASKGAQQFILVPNSIFSGAPMLNAQMSAQAANAQMNSLYKTELCRSWQFGTCKYVDRCLFAHGEHELRPLVRPRHNKYKTEQCITFHTLGFCPYGVRCNFVHDKDEHRQAKHSVPSLYKTRLCRTFIERGTCPYGDKCDFAHGTKDLSYDITKHPKYRTKLCRSFQDTGICVYGDRCCFSHVQSPHSKPHTPTPQSGATPEAPPSMTSAELLAQGEDSEATPKQKQKNKGDPETAIKICRRWKYTGKCQYGAACIFSHAITVKRAAQKRG